MPQRKALWKIVGRLVFLVLLGWIVAIARAVKPQRGWDEWSDDDEEWTPTPVSEDDTPDEPQPARRPFSLQRVATSAALVVVFFAAATFTAGAGDMVAKALDPARCAALMHSTGEDESVCSIEVSAPEAPAAEAEPAVEAAPEAAPEASPEPAPYASSTDGSAATQPDALSAAAAAAGTSPDATASEDAAAPSAHDATATPQAVAEEPLILAAEPQPAKRSSRHWVVRRAAETKLHALEIEDEGGHPTVWLNRALPDPTPPAKRLSPKFAKNLQRISAVNGVSWALVLGVLRAEGARDREPATVRELNTLATGLRKRGAADSEWNAVLSLSGRTGFADRAVALARYNRAIGLRSLIDGLEAAKPRLIERLLADSRISIYAGGRQDLEAGRIDVRVVVLLHYLAESYGEVTVSSLFSGHRKYARPGVVSAHTYGQAVDIATVGGISVAGHQEPGSITEKAVRSILMLPVEVQPRQVISLLGMGGPSFPMANHHDHIHVGY